MYLYLQLCVRVSLAVTAAHTYTQFDFMFAHAATIFIVCKIIANLRRQLCPLESTRAKGETTLWVCVSLY